MSQSLFPDLSPSAIMRLRGAYTHELLDNPPVRSLDPRVEPNEDVRRATARRLAEKDVNRILRALERAGLTLADLPEGGAR